MKCNFEADVNFRNGINLSKITKAFRDICTCHILRQMSHFINLSKITKAFRDICTCHILRQMSTCNVTSDFAKIYTISEVDICLKITFHMSKNAC